jgi:hypothetical protein
MPPRKTDIEDVRMVSEELRLTSHELLQYAERLTDAAMKQRQISRALIQDIQDTQAELAARKNTR